MYLKKYTLVFLKRQKKTSLYLSKQRFQSDLKFTRTTMKKKSTSPYMDESFVLMRTLHLSLKIELQ